MSIHIMAAVWETPIESHSAKLVLLALADNANDSGFCWPSTSTIARKCGLSRRSVSAKIAELQSAGLLRIAPKKGVSNHYIVTPKPAEKEDGSRFAYDEQPVKEVPTPCANSAQPLGTDCATPGKELPINHQGTIKEPSTKGARPITEEWLETIKPLYPSIDINHQLERARAWCATKGKELSQQRFTNWLKKSKPIAQAQTLSDETAFGYIWNRYPRHRRPIEKQSEIFSVYNQTVPDDKTDEVCEAFDRFVASEDWTKQGGKFVPSIGKFFANELWMNPPAKTEPKSIL
jgi:biotin operon repressor